MFATETTLTSTLPGTVWKVLTDFENWNSWSFALQEVKIKGAFEKNAHGTLLYKNGSNVRFVISHYVPESSYTLSFKSLMANVYIRRYIGYHNHKTTITNEVWAEGGLSDLWWMLFSASYKESLLSEVTEIRKMLESSKLLKQRDPVFML